MTIAFTRSSSIYDESRATKEILAFLDKGYDVLVFGWDRNGLAEQRCKELFQSYNNKIQFYFFNGKIGDNVIQKIASRMKWSKWLRTTLSKCSNIDIIHSCDYDTGYVVRRFAKANKLKYIYDIYDYYIDSHPVPKILRKIIENDEIKTINASETTIICTDERKEQIKKSTPKNIIVIHNSPDVNCSISNGNEEYDYVYCGSLFNGRLIKEILDQYPNHLDYKFIFAGSGSYAEQANNLSVNFENFNYLGSIPYSEVLNNELNSKVISAIYEPTIRNHQLCAPNKFYEALALGKPLIVCKGTGIDKVVEKYNLGIVINYNVDEFYNALHLLCSNDEFRNEIGTRARLLYEQNYKWTLMKEKLLNIYSEIFE